MKYIILIVFILFVIYAFIENFCLLTVRREDLGKGVRIVHLSDLHRKRFGRNNIRLCEKVKEQYPDMIILSGDLITRYEKDLSCAEMTLKMLCKIAPVYMIYGNHEQSISEEMRPELEAMFERSKVILLRNESSEININGRHLKVYGLLENYGVYKKNGGYRDLDTIKTDDLEKLLGKCPEGEVLLMAHNPFFAEAYAEWGAKYTFSGHIHGGAVRIFGIAMLSPERKFFPKNSKGVYTYGNMKLLVSAGLGKLRLFDPPEIVVYEI
ncbi:metallophosphoesterase [Ruminococcus flavefaciens]|uniref:metallophosphoesterase n=1 Tax=Ruminococcus flavefaciens TaxID=1265 RepID=UPI000492145F|nr:metallophosphoesterase [Ruminococcus flavefaciens]